MGSEERGEEARCTGCGQGKRQWDGARQDGLNLGGMDWVKMTCYYGSVYRRAVILPGDVRLSLPCNPLSNAAENKDLRQPQNETRGPGHAPRPVAHTASASRRLTSPGRPVHPTVFICIFSLPTYSQNLFMGYREDLCVPSAAPAPPRPMEASEGAGQQAGVAGGSFLCCVCQQETGRTR
ncbi:hypothetical protein E2C01_045757 [Portunus trituberculatus]|uniref:Uncharacterized protein n=1 Tax=Portunus trituberculatus TaxID=210409 RepID=A0A5B7FVZ8_PORTR|nr:hypothetical protein [Portunus trituberculatus]